MTDSEKFQQLQKRKDSLREEIYKIQGEMELIKSTYVKKHALPLSRWSVKEDTFQCENVEVIWQALDQLQGLKGHYYGGVLLNLYDEDDELKAKFQVHLSASVPMYCSTSEFIQFLKKHGATVKLDLEELKSKIQELEELVQAAQSLDGAGTPPQTG